MLQHKIVAAQDVAESLAAVEAAVDIALARAAELAAKMPQAWTAANVSVVVGMGAFDRVGELVHTMMQARRQTGEAHRILDTVRDKLNLPEIGWGDKMPEPTAVANVISIAA